MPTADYGRFYQASRLAIRRSGHRRVLGSCHPTASAWAAACTTVTFARPTATGGGNFWHWGAWTYNLRRAYDCTLSASYSAFAVRLGVVDTNMVAHIAPRLDKGGGQGKLDRTLGGAAEAVRNWP